MRFSTLLLLLLLSGCATPMPQGSFRGEALALTDATIFHWPGGLSDDAGQPLGVGRLALSFSETDRLCRRQRDFLDAADAAGLPNPLSDDQLADQQALFEEEFPVVDRWDLTFWLGVPPGDDPISGLEVDLAPTFDATFLNAEAVAARWEQTPPGDLLTWRSSRYYDEFAQTWTSVSGTIRVDSYADGEPSTGAITAIFEDATGEQARVDGDFEIRACFR